MTIASFVYIFRLRKGICTFLFLILLSSCTTPCRQWELTTIASTRPCSKNVKARLGACDNFQGLEAEILYSDGQTYLFLNSLTFCFPYSENNEKTIEIDINTGNEATSFSAIRLEGGQRIQLSEEAKNLIFTALLDDYPVSISVGRYQTIITPANFKDIYTSYY